jgi:hypothetical protein
MGVRERAVFMYGLPLLPGTTSRGARVSLPGCFYVLGVLALAFAG